MVKKYDLVVIGSGPGGEKAAVKAAYFGHSVALVEKESLYGGAGVHTGTLPSKTLKETSLYLSGYKEKGLYGIERELTHEATVDDFLFRKDVVTAFAGKEVATNLELHGVEIYHGIASFEDAHHIHVAGKREETLYGEHIIIATGSYPVHPEGIPFDEKRVHDSDSILDIKRFPKSICVVGAGVIGCEYATIFSAMGTKVYLINRSDRVLPQLDPDVRDHLLECMREMGIEVLFNTTIEKIQVPSSDEELIKLGFGSGEELEVDMYLFAAGRNGNVAKLNLEAAGVTVGKRELIEVNDQYQTSVPNIYAVGDVVGFPALASTSMDQGRAAVAHIFKTHDLEYISNVLPYGIYTIPEVSMVGLSEEQAAEQGLETVSGMAHHADTLRGKIMGAKHGFLKVIFTKDDLVIRGVHAIGSLATELIHYGMLLVQDQKTVMNVISTVFNTPTLHDLYKYACYDGLSIVTGKKVKL
jgi:NAD(P) transhydrogenase